jgi:protein-tyrosine-phosphatase
MKLIRSIRNIFKLANTKTKMNILFICRYNRFRSRIAEAMFKVYNTNEKFHVQSAGLIEGQLPLDSNQVKIAAEFGIKLQGKPQGLSVELLRWYDLAVVVADDVPGDLFKDDNKKYKKKIIFWKIHDPGDSSDKAIGRTIVEIEKKVRNLIEDLK